MMVMMMEIMMIMMVMIMKMMKIKMPITRPFFNLGVPDFTW